MNAEALDVLRGQCGVHSMCVVTYEGRPLSNPAGAAWHKALVRAGIAALRWHDLRHTLGDLARSKVHAA